MIASRVTRQLRGALAVAALLSAAACATCKSSDTLEQCRTKQRNHSQPRAALPTAPARDRAGGFQPAQPLGS